MDDRLNPGFTLSDYQLTQVTLVKSSSSSPASRSVSTSDILRLQQREAELLAREAVAAKRNLDRNRRSLIQQGRHKSVSYTYLELQCSNSPNSRGALCLPYVNPPYDGAGE